jgi:hypothetical protein
MTKRKIGLIFQDSLYRREQIAIEHLSDVFEIPKVQVIALAVRILEQVYSQGLIAPKPKRKGPTFYGRRKRRRERMMELIVKEKSNDK